ncbi:hypothetical protein MTO96_020644 [Rhipicephalus appendiculatus]
MIFKKRLLVPPPLSRFQSMDWAEDRRVCSTCSVSWLSGPEKSSARLGPGSPGMFPRRVGYSYILRDEDSAESTSPYGPVCEGI